MYTCSDKSGKTKLKCSFVQTDKHCQQILQCRFVQMDQINYSILIFQTDNIANIFTIFRLSLLKAVGTENFAKKHLQCGFIETDKHCKHLLQCRFV